MNNLRSYNWASVNLESFLGGDKFLRFIFLLSGTNEVEKLTGEISDKVYRNKRSTGMGSLPHRTNFKAFSCENIHAKASKRAT